MGAKNVIRFLALNISVMQEYMYRIGARASQGSPAARIRSSWWESQHSLWNLLFFKRAGPLSPQRDFVRLAGRATVFSRVTLFFFQGRPAFSFEGRPAFSFEEMSITSGQTNLHLSSNRRNEQTNKAICYKLGAGGKPPTIFPMRRLIKVSSLFSPCMMTRKAFPYTYSSL